MTSIPYINMLDNLNLSSENYLRKWSLDDFLQKSKNLDSSKKLTPEWRPFVPNIFKIGQWVFDKKIFAIWFPWQPVFYAQLMFYYL